MKKGGSCVETARNTWTRFEWMLVGVTALLVVLTFIHNGGGSSSDSVASLPRAGYVAPSISLVDLNGKSVRLQDLRGKKVFVNFWASWCPPCNEEAPDLVKMSERYKAQVVFLGVNLSSGDRESDARAFLKKYGVHFPTLMDRQGEAAKSYQVFAVPTSFFIDQHGMIIDRRDGPLSSTQMEAEIEKLIEVK